MTQNGNCLVMEWGEGWDSGHGVKVQVPSLSVALCLKVCSLSTITMSDVELNQQQQCDAFLAKTISHYEQLVQNLKEKDKEFVVKAEHTYVGQ